MCTDLWVFTTEICYGGVRTHAPFFSADCWLGVIPGIEDKRVSAIIMIFRPSVPTSKPCRINIILVVSGQFQFQFTFAFTSLYSLHTPSLHWPIPPPFFHIPDMSGKSQTREQVKRRCPFCDVTFCPQAFVHHVKKCERLKQAQEGRDKYEKVEPREAAPDRCTCVSILLVVVV